MKLNPIAENQTEIEYPDGTIVFFSYKTPVAVFKPGKGAFCTTEKFSKTTSKHVTQTVSRWGCNRISIDPKTFKSLIPA